jgi:predicted phage-related endonuclease
MERIVHHLVPGSDAWHAFRLEHDGASECAAMLGLSKKMSRTELLRMKHTGLPREFSDWLQSNVLDKGHEVEALARPFAVEFAGVDGFYPATVSIGRLSASCDGLDMPDETAWENKLLNQENGPIVKSGRVPDEHMPQCQQVLMVTGADRLLFTVSDGTPENTHHVWVEPDTTWFDRIRAGWKQFHEDLANYQPTEAAPVVVAAVQPSLPAVVVRMDGALTVASNLPDFAVALRNFIANIPAKPSTDQEFADAESACKALKSAEAALEQAENNALSQMTDVEQMRRVVGDLRTLSKTTRLATEKLVAARKEAIRTEIYQEGVAAYKVHIDGLNKRIGRPYMPVLPVDFAGAIKNKRTVDSLRDAVNTHLANAKIAANDVADRIQINLTTMRELAADHVTLFPDTAQLVLKGNDDLTALVKTRIAEHLAAEQRRADALAEQARERIAAEERAKAEKALREEQEARDRAADLERRNAEAKALEAVVPPAPPQVQPEPEQAAPVPVQTFTPPAPYVAERQETSPPTMTNGKVCQILGFNVTADFLVSIGAPAPTKQGNANLWHERQIVNIVEALGQHLQAVHTAQKAKYQPARSRTPA